jgi:hypothetical protein
MHDVFARDGYEVVPAVLTEERIAELQAAVASTVERFRRGEKAVLDFGFALSDHTRAHPERNPGVNPDDVEGEPYLLGGLAGLDERFRLLLAAAPLWGLAARLLAVPQDAVVYHYAQVLRKPAGIGPALSWHRDYANTYISTRGAYFVRLLMPLQGMSVANGGTGVVPGSHFIDDASLADERATPDITGPVFPHLAAGDVLALHPKTVHGGGTNRGAGDRDLLAIQFGVRDAALLHAFPDEPFTLAGRSDFAPFVLGLSKNE